MNRSILILCTVFLSSCVSQVLIDDVTDVNTDSSYIFARLQKGYISADEQVYLVCLSADGMREHLLSFEDSGSLVVKEVFPGEYQIAGYRVITGNGIQDIGFFTDQNQRMMDRFFLRPGEAVYLGDYMIQSQARDASTARPGSLRVIIQDALQTAKFQLRSRYEGFDRILVKNLMAR